MRIEPRIGGRLFETIETKAGPREVKTGEVTVWEPPARLVFEWQGLTFAPNEKTEVEVQFTSSPNGT